MRWVIVFVIAFYHLPVSAQNYLGYPRQYIMNALKTERKDMKGPVKIKDDGKDFISYVAKDGKRVVFYHFKSMEITLENGKKADADICYKYVSKNMCRNYSKCPEMETVVRSLNSRFTPSGENVWMDYSQKTPHEWLLVKEDNFFEVHVTEKK